MIVANKPKNEITQDIKLTIDEEPYVEMMRYAHLFTPTECSGTGLVERMDFNDGSTEFNVSKIYLPNQHNTGGTTDVDEDEMNRINTQIVNDGDDPEMHKFHWHSHVDMSVFHSITDDENYDELQTGDYAVSLVVNKKYDMLASVHLYNPLRINILNIEVDPPDVDFKDYVLSEGLQKKLEENINRVKKYEEDHTVPTVYHGRNNRHYNQQDWWAENGEGEHMSGYSDGLSYDPDFEALLEAGEKQGIMKLFKDRYGSICGYMNLRTMECYELSSFFNYNSRY